MVHILSLSLAFTAVLPPLVSALPVASPDSISPSTPLHSHTSPLTYAETYPEHIPLVHGKRVDQTTEDAVAPWKADCITLFDQEICFNIAADAGDNLLFAADVCAQQDSADQMISFAKSFAQNQTSQSKGGNGKDKGNKDSSKADKSKEKSNAKEHPAQNKNATGSSIPPNSHGSHSGLNATQEHLVKNMIDLAVIYAQQPRNTNNDFSVPYCQRPPNNTELVGIYQCQFSGLSNTTYNIIGNPNLGKTIQLGEPGTIPFGMTTPVSPPGSCPSHPAGPVPANVQLVELLRPSGAAGAHTAAKGGHATAKRPQATGAPSHH